LQWEFAAEGRFRVALEHREKPFAVVAHHDRLVVGDDLRAEAEHEQREEDP